MDICSTRSSQYGMEIEIPLLFVAEVSRRRGTALREFEGVPQNPVDADAGHHRILDHGLTWGVLEDLAADAGVLALGVLPHHVEVDVAGFAAGEWSGDAGQQAHGAQVDVLVEMAAELDQASPQRDVVGNEFGPADRAEEDGVESPQLLEPVVGHHLAVLEVVVDVGVVEFFEVQGEAEPLRGGLQHP